MKICLLLVDIQNDYFPNGKLELNDMDGAAGRAGLLLEAFRKKSLPLVHIQHISTRPDATFFLPDTDGVKINNAVTPIGDEVVIEKNFPNSFRNTGLLKELQKKSIDTLVICGAMSHMCIDATTRAAFDYGFTCYVAEDACTTRDLQFNDRTISAGDVHASFMAALSVPYAQVLKTEDLLKTLL